MFSWLFPSSRDKKKAYKLYGKLVDQARQPIFYTDFGVTDSIDGRFDMIVLHLFMVERGLARDGDATATIRRQLQEAMFSDMDRSLRELGVGDMGIGKEVKKMGVAWFGRLKAYAAAMEEDDPRQALIAALSRNLYRFEEGDAPHAGRMADYVIASSEILASLPPEDVINLSFSFAETAPAAG